MTGSTRKAAFTFCIFGIFAKKCTQ